VTQSKTRTPIDSNFYYLKAAFLLITYKPYTTARSLPFFTNTARNTNTNMKKAMKQRDKSSEDRAEKALLVQELHGGLSRRYENHKVEIEALWRSFDTEQRTIYLTTPSLRPEDLDHSKTGK
jgi:signal transduction histidine kinase